MSLCLPDPRLQTLPQQSSLLPPIRFGSSGSRVLPAPYEDLRDRNFRIRRLRPAVLSPSASQIDQTGVLGFETRSVQVEVSAEVVVLRRGSREVTDVAAANLNDPSTADHPSSPCPHQSESRRTGAGARVHVLAPLDRSPNENRACESRSFHRATPPASNEQTAGRSTCNANTLRSLVLLRHAV